jgi:hypothetical protein
MKPAVGAPVVGFSFTSRFTGWPFRVVKSPPTNRLLPSVVKARTPPGSNPEPPRGPLLKLATKLVSRLPSARQNAARFWRGTFTPAGEIAFWKTPPTYATPPITTAE